MKLRNSLLLLITATIWGTAFVAQSVGMDYVGPMTYVCARSIIGMIVLLPVIAVLNRVGPPRAAETQLDIDGTIDQGAAQRLSSAASAAAPSCVSQAVRSSLRCCTPRSARQVL